MRIEIDTKSDNKEELRHIAHMLLLICGESASSQVVSGSEYNPRHYSGNDLFSNQSAPAQRQQESGGDGGFFNMFGDSSAQESQQPQEVPQSQQSIASQQQQSQTGDIFSLFSDSSSQRPQSSSSLLEASSHLKERLSKKRDFLAEGHLIPYD